MNWTMQKSSWTVAVTLKHPLISWDVSFSKIDSRHCVLQLPQSSSIIRDGHIIRWWYFTRLPMSLLTINSWRSSIDSWWEMQVQETIYQQSTYTYYQTLFQAVAHAKWVDKKTWVQEIQYLMKCLVCIQTLHTHAVLSIRTPSVCTIINNGLNRSETMNGIANDGQFYFDYTSFWLAPLLCFLCASWYVFLLW